MSTFTEIEDKLDEVYGEHRILLNRKSNTTDTSAAINSAPPNDRNAPILQTASSSRSRDHLIDLKAK